MERDLLYTSTMTQIERMLNWAGRKSVKELWEGWKYRISLNQALGAEAAWRKNLKFEAGADQREKWTFFVQALDAVLCLSVTTCQAGGPGNEEPDIKVHSCSQWHPEYGKLKRPILKAWCNWKISSKIIRRKSEGEAKMDLSKTENSKWS